LRNRIKPRVWYDKRPGKSQRDAQADRYPVGRHRGYADFRDHQREQERLCAGAQQGRFNYTGSRRKPVSDNSLRKTGIFAGRAGDFRRFPPQDRRTGSPETNRMREKPVFASIATSLGQLGRMQEWLAEAGGYEPRPKRPANPL